MKTLLAIGFVMLLVATGTLVYYMSLPEREDCIARARHLNDALADICHRHPGMSACRDPYVVPEDACP